MAAGVAVAVKAVRPQCKVLAVEPEEKCLENSLRARKRLWSNPPALLNTKAGNLLDFDLFCLTVIFRRN